MDGKEKITASSLSENEVKNYTASACSFCHSHNKSTTISSWTIGSPYGIESSTKRPTIEKEYPRQEMITALAWAICRTFEYQPSDPIHYLAHQLLRWRYGDASNKNYSKTNRCNDTCIE